MPMAVTSRPMGFISSSLPTKAMVWPTSFRLPTKPPLSRDITPPTLPLIMFMVVPMTPLAAI